MNRLCFALLVVASSSVLDFAPARGGVLYGGGQLSKNFYSINPNTAERIVSRHLPHAVSPFDGINGLAYNTRDQRFYATTVNNIPRPPRGSTGLGLNLYRIDPNAFAVDVLTIGGLSLPLGNALDGFEYDSKRNVFWATVPSRGELLRIDAENYQATLVGNFAGVTHISGLAYDRATDTLFGVGDVAGGSNLQSHLVAIDVETAAITRIGTPGLGLGLNDLDSLAFDPINRWLYSINDQGTSFANQQQLVRIDPTTGLASAIGPAYVSLEVYQGLTFVVPEPHSGWTWACAGILALCFSRTTSPLRAVSPH